MIILLPEYEKRKKDVDKMRAELSMLLLERDELQFVICKNVETDYMLKLGALEYKAYQAQCTALRLKRKVELIQAKKNRQEKVLLCAIEQTLDAEFAQYQKKLDEQIDKMDAALKRSKARFLSEEENKELKKLYRQIVKNLHPDINPGATDAQLKLLQNAVSAYKCGDLPTLRIIAEMAGSAEETSESNALSSLEEQEKRLKASLATLRDDITEIKSQYPYTMKEILEDKEKTAQKKAEFEEIIKQYDEIIAAYQTKIDQMLR